MKPAIVRLVVRGPQAWSADRGERLLLAALAEIRRRQGDAVLVTPGGFLRAEWPRDWNGRAGWQSRPGDIERLVDSGADVVGRTLTRSVLDAACAQGVEHITLGVDLFAPWRTGSRAHAELVAVVETRRGTVTSWTGKSYPTAAQERDLVQVVDLRSHFVELGSERAFVLGCHDLNMFSARGRATQRRGGPRDQRCTAMWRLVAEAAPTIVLHHPHTVDSTRIWSTAWSGVRKQIPTATTWASGIWFHDWRSGPRGELRSVLASTASPGVVDVTVGLPLRAGMRVAVYGDRHYEWGEVHCEQRDDGNDITTAVRLIRGDKVVRVPTHLLAWHPDELPDREDRA